MTDQQKVESTYSEPAYAQVEQRRQYPFYHSNIEHKIPSETRELLSNYSGIPKADQIKHVHEIRDRAFDVRAYPCTGLGSWLVPQLRRLPNYADILRNVKDGALLLDIGTFVGHDLRRLVYDGPPSENLYGIDIADHFDIGFDFFRDRSTFKGHFIQADFLSTSTDKLAPLRGRADFILISQVIHQWDWDNQVRAVKTLVSFTKPRSVVMGNQIGNLKSQEIPIKGFSVAPWRHDPESFTKLWNDVGQATGTKWDVQAWLRTFSEMGWDPEDAAWMEPGVRLMEFVVKRVL